MSLAEDEAERVYPTRYWDGTHVKEKCLPARPEIAEAVSLLFILFCRDPQFRRSLYKLDPVLFRRFTNGEVWL